MRQVIIIGSGPAGYTAAIYAARANLAPLVIASSVEAGGELMNTTEVENFPGFPEGVMGPELMERMQQQAERFGAEVVFDDVTELDLRGDVKRVVLGSGIVEEARAVIFATGSAYRKLGLPDEERLSGHGVSWCATCDGAFFREQHIAVIGGGDSAIEEALFLTRFASKVTIVHRRHELRASKIMQERAFSNEKISFVWNAAVTGIRGESNVEGLELTDTATGRIRDLDVTGVFVAIGNDPRVHLVHGQLDLTPEGTVAVTGRSSLTNLAGVFAAGDVIDPHYRQAVTAAGSGTVAALDAERYLAALDESPALQGEAPLDEIEPSAHTIEESSVASPSTDDREHRGRMMTGASTITMYGADWCGDCRRTKRQLDGLGVATDYIDVQSDAEAAEKARAISGRTNIPVVVYPDGTHMVEPSNAEVDEKLRELSII